jgi:hypothetical protein
MVMLQLDNLTTKPLTQNSQLAGDRLMISTAIRTLKAAGLASNNTRWVPAQASTLMERIALQCGDEHSTTSAHCGAQL